MGEFLITIIDILLICLIVTWIRERKEQKKNKPITENNNYNNIEIIKNEYVTKNYIMTKTELQFFKMLQNTIEENNMQMYIFPQVNLENIIQAKNNEFANRNKIKSRSIDFTIVSKENCKIICCIELDDYTHNSYERINRDDFINQLFRDVKIKLIRVTVSNNYNIEKIIKLIKEVD